MDEPFGAVDPLTRERLQAQFARIQEELKKTVIMVTHDLDEAKAIEAKQAAEQALKDRQSDIDYAKAQAELAEAVAQLQTIQRLRKKAGSTHG